MRKFVVLSSKNNVLDIIKIFAESNRIIGFNNPNENTNSKTLLISAFKLIDYLLEHETLDIKNNIKIVNID